MLQTKITNKKSAILAIYPHIKTIGFAVMDSPTSVKTSGYKYVSAHDTTAYIQYITFVVGRHKPKLIILEDEKSRSQRRGKHMRDIFKKIEEAIAEMNYPILYYSRDDIRTHFGGVGKQEVAGEIAAKFPKFIDHVPKPRAKFDGAESPRLSEFDALSLCITHFAHIKI